MKEVEGDLAVQPLDGPMERHARLQLVASSVDAMDHTAVFYATEQDLTVRQTVRDNNMHFETGVPEKADNTSAGDG
jgi:hypothetical protein